MRKIMVLNPKGGCGKTTLATNLASYYANTGKTVSLLDFDVQYSSRDWLSERPKSAGKISKVKEKGDEYQLKYGLEYLVMDLPAGLYGKQLKQYLKLAESIIIPVLPSPIDIRATARFIEDLLLVGRISRERTRIAVVANRVREHTRVYQSLERFLTSLGIPFLTSLRDSQNYIRAAEKGVGVFELPHYMVEEELKQWQPIIDWLESEQSLPIDRE